MTACKSLHSRGRSWGELSSTAVLKGMAWGVSFLNSYCGACRAPQQAADACIESLRQHGYADAAIVGRVLPTLIGEDNAADAARRLIEIGYI